MLNNLALSVVMTVIVVVVHFTGLMVLMHFLRSNAHRVSAKQPRGNVLRQSVLMISVALGVFLLHGIEIWLYALAYLVVGALKEFETALYYSSTAFSTLGFGDVVLGPQWRLFGAVEGVTGLILIGWSSAFLLSVTSRLSVLEHDWETSGKRKRKG